MLRYLDDRSLLEARNLFFRDARLGADGGYGDRWVRIEAKPIPFYFPNWPARVAAARLHDLHHIAAEGAFSVGLVIAPKRLFRAFLRGRRAKTNLYKGGFDESRLDDITVGILRDQLGLRAALPSAGATDVALFLLWCILSVLIWLPLPLVTVVLLWLIVARNFG
ncbi:MAG: hypothetical protein AUG52_01205 [Verrucomicrobia bacterium 13_1_20CM_3_54_17]|nr:MAG: hypothetical protein AUG52_01205 [Verrucomicrobia bacterium 13_1_20CM_3_54_17]